MTRDGEVSVLREHLDACVRLAAGLARVRQRIATRVPLAATDMASLSDDAHVDVLAFLKTFEQFEEALGRTLKVIAMLMQLGKPERLSPRDVANRAVALGILDQARDWADAVRVRNALAHEYPLRPDRQAEQVNDAWRACDTLFATRASIEGFVAREGLLDGTL